MKNLDICFPFLSARIDTLVSLIALADYAYAAEKHGFLVEVPPCAFTAYEEVGFVEDMALAAMARLSADDDFYVIEMEMVG